MKPKILGEKWINPYEISQNTGEVLDDIPSSNFEDYDHWETYSDEETDEETSDNEHSFKSHTKTIITPMGMIPINERTPCTKTFKFWIGHTNFTISKEHHNIIDNTDGVEVLDIFTRYRFRVAIGKAFQDREVMQLIQENLYEKLQ